MPQLCGCCKISEGLNQWNYDRPPEFPGFRLKFNKKQNKNKNMFSCVNGTMCRNINVEDVASLPSLQGML